MKKLAGVLVAVTLTVTVWHQAASALPQFNAEFKAMYIKPEGDEKERKLAAAFEKEKCNTCHGKNAEGKDDKKVRNVYGKALDELLTKDDKANKEKIQKALREVESKRAKEGGPTFGELLKDGRLPASE
jgi:hypothetical protein